jgi:hypothetical protein
MFDLGLDVEMTEYQENIDILLSMFDAYTSFDEIASIDFDGVASTSNREVLRELNQAFSTERSEHQSIFYFHIFIKIPVFSPHCHFLLSLFVTYTVLLIF